MGVIWPLPGQEEVQALVVPESKALSVGDTGRPGRLWRFTVVVVTAGVAIVGWLGWLGWHEKKHRVPGTLRIEGPFAPWQVIGLILTLIASVAVFAWLGYGKQAALTSSASVTVMFSLDSGSQPTVGANMWLAGGWLLLIGSCLGLGLVAFIVFGMRLAVDRLRARRQSRSAL